MKKLFVRALALAALFGLAGGCAPTIRSVTHVGAYGPPDKPYIYVAYAENNDTSRLQLCTINDDNSLDCRDIEEVNRLLAPEEAKSP